MLEYPRKYMLACFLLLSWFQQRQQNLSFSSLLTWQGLAFEMIAQTSGPRLFISIVITIYWIDSMQFEQRWLEIVQNSKVLKRILEFLFLFYTEWKYLLSVFRIEFLQKFSEEISYFIFLQGRFENPSKSLFSWLSAWKDSTIDTKKSANKSDNFIFSGS